MRCVICGLSSAETGSLLAGVIGQVCEACVERAATFIVENGYGDGQMRHLPVSPIVDEVQVAHVGSSV